MRSLAFSRRIALRYLWSGRTDAAVTLITVISVVGVAIGVVTLTVVMSVMTGFQTTLREKILGADAHVVVRSEGGLVGDWREAKTKIASVPGVESVSAFTYHQALVRTEDRSSGVLVKGIEEEGDAAARLRAYLPAGRRGPLFGASASPGDAPPAAGEGEGDRLPGLVIGGELSRVLGVTPGRTVSLLSPQVGSTPFGLVPKFRRFVVTGTYRSGLVEYESGLAYAALSDARSFFRTGDAVSGLEVRCRSVDDAPEVAGAVLEALGGIGSGFTVQDWTQSNRAFFEAMALEKKVYFIVLLLIIVMASFSIISSLVMIVIEKRRDIAVLRTLGAGTAAVGDVFRIQGAVIGGTGVASGLLLGYVTCLLLRAYRFPIDERIFQMSTLPVTVDPVNFAAVGAAAFAICCLATIYPARRAGRVEPAEALRYE